jgi:hypothetical protein
MKSCAIPGDGSDQARFQGRQDQEIYCLERRQLLDQLLQRQANDALARLQDEIDWLRAMSGPSAAAWPEIWNRLQERIGALAEQVDQLVREMSAVEGRAAERP